MSKLMTGTSLLKYTESSPEVIGWGHILEEEAAKKLASKLPKYGPLIGTEAHFNTVLVHLLEEVVELLVAYYDDEHNQWEKILLWMEERAREIAKEEPTGVDGELIDIINVAYVAYIYGKIQKEI